MPSRDGWTPAPDSRAGFSRRSFLKGAGGGVVAGALTGGLARPASAAPAAPLPAEAQDAPPGTPTVSGEHAIVLKVNGQDLPVTVVPQTTLLSALRHHVSPPLTGTKEVCDQGSCGACTVLVDGRPVYACMQLADDMPGRTITTVEGIGTPEAMSPVQAEICRFDGLMCGFCTPGFVMASTACLEKHGTPDRTTIQRELSGNICRCGTQGYIFDAVQAAAAGGKGGAK